MASKIGDFFKGLVDWGQRLDTRPPEQDAPSHGASIQVTGYTQEKPISSSTMHEGTQRTNPFGTFVQALWRGIDSESLNSPGMQGAYVLFPEMVEDIAGVLASGAVAALSEPVEKGSIEEATDLMNLFTDLVRKGPGSDDDSALG